MRRGMMDLMHIFIGISIHRLVKIYMRSGLMVIDILFNKNDLVLALIVLGRKGKVAQETGLVLLGFLGKGFDCVEGLVH